jgi:hypothetical protein
MSKHDLIESARLDFGNGLRKLENAGGDADHGLGQAMISAQEVLDWIDAFLETQEAA